MHRVVVAFLVCFLALVAAPAQAVTIEQAMANPDWIGSPVESAWWSVDGGSIYYRVKQKGSSISDLHRIDVASGKDSLIGPEQMGDTDGEDVVFDRAHRRAAFTRNGDVFVRDIASGRLTQITRTTDREASVQFSADERAVQFRVGNDWFSHDLGGGESGPAAIIKREDDPEAKKLDALEELQLHLFSTLREVKADREAKRKHDEEFRKADASRAPATIFLGKDVAIVGSSLSPDARHMIVVTTPKGYDAGKQGKLQRFVTESGYEEQETERTRVGRNEPAPQSVWLLDLVSNEKHALSLDALPGIHDDPLAAIREENRKAGKLKAEDKDKSTDAKDDKKKDTPKARGVRVLSDAEDGGGGGIVWSRDGSNVAIQLRAIDNKDRWIASVDFAGHKLVNRNRLTDEAWINWNFNDFGWENDNHTLWYLSEESGYSHLYTIAASGKSTALTRGTFEVSHPHLSADGKWFYLRANAEAPYSYDLYRIAVGGGDLQRITHLKAIDGFALSPDDRQLLVLHSTAYLPPQLAVTSANGGASVRDLTDTRTAEFKAMQWQQPEIVAVPSSHTKQPIYAKFYKPANIDRSKKYPAVLFVHGAGYLQNVHLGYPAYFREQMFNNLLTEHGYFVLDMDYRASEGYGRDRRTAIYRDMGHPELEDLLDGKQWLVKNYPTDAARFGIYGGSYGGFMSLMALFRAPGEFKAGAALRPVTDWTQYNHEYTSNILNSPLVDPIAYDRSSPIEFADGLADSLLICHGMIDNNVLFEDSARLYQKLIELHKDNFEIAPYPVERHGFVHADSWLDEYKRIFKLFEANLK